MESRPSRLILFAILAAALLVRLPNLSESLWYDEVYYTHLGFARETLARALFGDIHPPLYALLLFVWIQIFGDSEISIRMPSLLSGIASLAVVHSIARAWFGERTALLATGLMALSPAHIWYSQEAKTNMVALLLSSWAVWRADRAWNGDRPRDWVLLVVASTLALWTHAYAVGVVAAAFAWLLVRVLGPGRSRRGRALAAALAVGALYSPIAWWALPRLGEMQTPSYLRPFGPGEIYELLLIYLSHGNTLRTISPHAPFRDLLAQPWPYFLIDGFFGFLLLRGLWFAFARRRAAHRRADAPESAASELLLLYLFVPLLGLFLGSLRYPHFYIERSMLILLPPLVVLLAAGALGTRGRVFRAAALAGLVLANGAALFNLWVAKADVWTVYKPNPDWRSLARVLDEELEQGEGPVMLVATASLDGLFYHLQRRAKGDAEAMARLGRLEVVYLARVAEKSRDRIHAEALESAVRSFHVIGNLHWRQGFTGLVEGLMGDARFRIADRRSLEGLEILDVELRGPAPAPPGGAAADRVTPPPSGAPARARADTAR